MEKSRTNDHASPLSLQSRLQTAGICLPLLTLMLSSQFFYMILMLLVIFITHKEFYTMEILILKQMFTDQNADITSSTLLSSPLQTYVFTLCPILFYCFQDGEIFTGIFILSLIVCYRLNCFLYIHRLINGNEFEFSSLSLNCAPGVMPGNVIKIKNPIPTIDAEVKNKTGLPTTSSSVKPEINQTAPPTKSNSKQIISQKMSTACLTVILLDFVYFFVYCFPLCFGISMFNINNHGFIYLFMLVFIAYLCDTGAMLVGRKFGKHPFGAPITPSKTFEGIYGGIIIGLLSAFVFRFLILLLTNVEMLGFWSYFLYSIFSVATALLGDFFESFLKRCANIKDSGDLLPGHGGLLDRVDSLTLGVPLCYYFFKELL